MKAQDIVNKLSALIPRFTADFSDSLSIVSIVPTGTTALVTTSVAHNLIEGQNVAINGATAPVDIDTASFLRTGTTAEFLTLQDHDFTLSERDKAFGGKTITISGATEAEFTGTFDLLRVVNRRKLIIAVADAGPTAITGSPIVEDAAGQVFNGLVAAVNVTPTTFEYELAEPFAVPAVVTSAFVQVSIRIASVLDIEQYLIDVYTKQDIGENQLIVQLGDVVQSKRRDENTDAASSSIGNYSYTPMIVQPFAVYIVQNVTNSLTATEARDKVEEVYVPAIFSALMRATFNSGFLYSAFSVTFTGHGVFAYSSSPAMSKAVYVHEVSFEQLSQLCKQDMNTEDSSVALRDIDYALTTDIGTGEMTASVNLDEEPL